MLHVRIMLERFAAGLAIERLGDALARRVAGCVAEARDEL
jgi:DNA-binding GntR family transcriptional regulator